MSRASHSGPFSSPSHESEDAYETSELLREIPDLEEGAAPTPEALTEALIYTTHTLKQFINLCMEASPHMPRLSMPRAHLFLVVAEAGTVRMGDLSRILGVTPRNVTTLVDAIEREGLIVRRPDPIDRRAILLELSEEGAAMMNEVHSVQQSIAEKIFAPLNATERRQFYDMLRRLSDAAQHAGADEDNQKPSVPWSREDPRDPAQAPHERLIAAHQAHKERLLAKRKANREEALARRALTQQRRQRDE